MITKSFKRELLQGIHASTDTFKVALFNSSAVLDENTTVYSATNEITGTGYVAGGCTLAGATVTNNVSAGELNFDAFTYTNCSIVARKALVYNSSKGNKAVAVIDYGVDTGVVGSGTFVVDVVIRIP